MWSFLSCNIVWFSFLQSIFIASVSIHLTRRLPWFRIQEDVWILTLHFRSSQWKERSPPALRSPKSEKHQNHPYVLSRTCDRDQSLAKFAVRLRGLVYNRKRVKEKSWIELILSVLEIFTGVMILSIKKITEYCLSEPFHSIFGLDSNH